MEYTEMEMLNKDIDWFLQIQSRRIHVASAGGMLPYIIQREKDYNEERFRIISQLPDLYADEELEVNPLLRTLLHIDKLEEEYGLVLETLNIPLGNDVIDTYLSKLYVPAFSKFARKGFISFDNTNFSKEGLYHWVVKPSKAILKEWNEGVELNLPVQIGNEEKLTALIRDIENGFNSIPLVELVNGLDDV